MEKNKEKSKTIMPKFGNIQTEINVDDRYTISISTVENDGLPYYYVIADASVDEGLYLDEFYDQEFFDSELEQLNTIEDFYEHVKRDVESYYVHNLKIKFSEIFETKYDAWGFDKDGKTYRVRLFGCADKNSYRFWEVFAYVYIDEYSGFSKEKLIGIISEDEIIGDEIRCLDEFISYVNTYVANSFDNALPFGELNNKLSFGDFAIQINTFWGPSTDEQLYIVKGMSDLDNEWTFEEEFSSRKLLELKLENIFDFIKYVKSAVGFSLKTYLSEYGIETETMYRLIA